MTDNLPDRAQTSEWVEQLHAPQTRWRARHRLVSARAVDALLECLGSSNESVVWAAVTSLGELRATEAVAPLADLLEKGILEMDVCESLRQITGKDLGTNPRAWRKMIGAGVGEASLDVAQCIARTADYLGISPAGSNGSYVFKLSLPDGRTQKVAVYFGRKDTEGHELVIVYSECAPAEAKYYEALLRKNLSMPFGAFAIRDLNGEANFVMVETLLAGALTPSVLARKIEQIAAHADQIENLLTQEDRR